MFTRRFAVFPSLAVLLAVSGVVIIDAPPPVPVSSAPFGKICVVGEFEDGPFNTPTDLLTSSDQPTIFGGLGYTYGSSKYQYACALRSGGTEPWNGNGWVQSTKLPFAGVCFVRVDTSVGEVALTPRAFVQGSAKGPFALSAGQTLKFTPNGGGEVTATFAATAATHTGTAGTFTSFTGGETLTIAFNGSAAITVVFQPSDTSLAAIISRINTAFGAVVASNASSQLKLTSTQLGSGSSVAITAGAAATTLGLTAGSYAGGGDAVDISSVTVAELRTKVEAASALVLLTTSSAGFPRIVSKLAGSGTVAIGAGTANDALGFTTTGAPATAATPYTLSIPAGTRASDGGASETRVVTMQSTMVPVGTAETILLRVRPAIDDGSFSALASAAIDTLEDAPGDLEWSVGNPVGLTDALTAAQLDSAYIDAIASTIGVGNNVTKRISGILSARQSGPIRAALVANAVDASANGHLDRRAFLSPPVGTSAATILGASSAGVQTYRAEEASFAPGDCECVLQEMIAGGYTSDGVVVRHLDALLASRFSTLPPGFNPGQLPEETSFRFPTAIFRGLGSEAKKWTVDTYAAFKAAGVSAGFFDAATGITFEQGLTTVDPATDEARSTIARRTLAGSIGDSLAAFALPTAKRQGTDARREALKDSIEGYLDRLLEPAARDAATVREYLVSFRTSGLPAGVVEYLVAVTPIGSDDVIVFNLKVGANAVALSRAA